MMSEYHQASAAKSNERIDHQAQVKEQGLRQIFSLLGKPSFSSPQVKISILGCADRRLVAHHQTIFQNILEKPLTISTFDIDIEHLKGETGVVQHDATIALPNGPYDLVYADVLVRFIQTDKQFLIFKNAYDALAPGGWAIINFGKEDFDPPPNYIPTPGTYPVDLNALQGLLAQLKIPFQEAPIRFETTIPGSDQPILIDELSLILRKP